MNKDKKMLFGIGIVFLFLATVSLSYAYFTATIVNKDVKDQVVQTGTLELTYTDSPEIAMQNIKPGATITKEVSVKNTGTLSTSYNLVWQELANEIINDEMVIEATCTRLNANGVEERTCENLTSTPIKRIKIKENVSIEANIIHKYNITITFKETNADQNYNQGKSFTGTLGINEYVENTPIYCTFDGEMVQGAEYVNGQYTYRYMQEGTPTSTVLQSFDYDSKIKATFMNNYSPSFVNVKYEDISWQDISIDGWGVQLTDKNSTDPVISDICTYINGKPVVSMSFMLMGNYSSVKLDRINTSNIVNMSGMFGASLATNLDLSNFDTSNVTDMSGMFSGCEALNINVTNFDTSKVTDMSWMFSGIRTKILNLDNFNTSKVTDMSGMFSETHSSYLNLKNFDTSNVTDMSSMFQLTSLESIDLSNFNTSKVTNMSSMFYNCDATFLDLSSFDISNVLDMSSMLGGYYIENKVGYGYAKDEATAAIFNDHGKTGIPSNFKFTVKQ